MCPFIHKATTRALEAPDQGKACLCLDNRVVLSCIQLGFVHIGSVELQLSSSSVLSSQPLPPLFLDLHQIHTSHVLTLLVTLLGIFQMLSPSLVK